MLAVTIGASASSVMRATHSPRLNMFPPSSRSPDHNVMIVEKRTPCQCAAPTIMLPLVVVGMDQTEWLCSYPFG